MNKFILAAIAIAAFANADARTIVSNAGAAVPGGRVPVRVANVTGILGVNTHIPENNWGYQNTATLESNLTYLGFHIMRDSAEATADVGNISTVANAVGMKVDDFIGETSQPQMSVDLSLMSNYAPGVLASIEGGDEEDDSYPQGLGNTLAATAALQKSSVWPLGGTLGLPVIQMSFGAGWTASNGYIGDYATQGNLSAYATWGNAHTYPQTGQNPAYSISTLNGLAQLCSPTDPVATTEIGWNTSVFTQAQIGQFVVDAAMDAQVYGDVAMYFYAVYDDGSGAWGLFNSDGTTRPASVSLHNLTTLLADTGPTATTFSPVSQNFSVAGSQAGEATVLMETSAGVYWLAIWNETEAATYTDTISFGGRASGGGIYDVTTGTSPTSTFGTVTSVSVTVGAYPIFVKVSGL